MNNETNQNQFFNTNQQQDRVEGNSAQPIYEPIVTEALPPRPTNQPEVAQEQQPSQTFYTQVQTPIYAGQGVPSGTPMEFQNNVNSNTQQNERVETQPMSFTPPVVENNTVPDSMAYQQSFMQPTGSFTEMPFAGVNQQEMEEQKTDILPNTSKQEKIENKIFIPNSSNMQPVEKKADENAGLKFLLFLFIILLIVILCLPLIGLN